MGCWHIRMLDSRMRVTIFFLDSTSGRTGDGLSKSLLTGSLGSIDCASKAWIGGWQSSLRATMFGLYYLTGSQAKL